jgi:uncharacterized protein
MKVQLDKLYPGEHRFEIQIDAQELELDLESFPDPIKVVMSWDRRDPNIQIRFEINAKLKTVCDRCLRNLTVKIEGQANLLVQLREDVSVGSEDPDFKLVPPTEKEIDFTNDIRDAILLAIPYKILCKKNCKGLCPHCGADLNKGTCDCPKEMVITQWEALLKLKNNRQ